MEDMERLGGEDRGQQTSVRRVIFATLIGTTIEWYDFFVYRTAAEFSDKIGRRSLYMDGLALLALFTSPFYWLLNTRVSLLVYLALVASLISVFLALGTYRSQRHEETHMSSVAAGRGQGNTRGPAT